MAGFFASQLPLDLGYQPSLTRDDFLVAPCNQIAVHWIDRWPAWPAHALVLIGPAASGKTHLARIWAGQSGAEIITPDNLSERLIHHRPSGHLVIDQADLLIGDRKAEEILFHLYNSTKAAGDQLLLTMRAAPFALSFTVPDLASRLRASLTIGIEEPDDELLSAVLVKLFHDRQVRVHDDVVRYIVPRMERSFAAAADLVAHADEMALAQKASVTIPLVRGLLQTN
jgi:chromosomal replication initiation ATPase DnaA